MIEMLKAVAVSRKAWGAALALLVVGGLTLAGKVDGPVAVDFSKWIVGIWISAVAAEDVAKKIGGAA